MNAEYKKVRKNTKIRKQSIKKVKIKMRQKEILTQTSKIKKLKDEIKYC